MMFRKLMTVAALAAVTATAASAQEAASSVANKPLTFGINAGAAIPIGDFGDGAKTGFAVGGTVGYKVASLPFSFRGDVNYNQFSGKVAGSVRGISVLGNIVYDLPMQSTLRPYVLGGLGFVNSKVKGAGDSENAFMFNGGAGISLPLSGFDTYVEARYAHASKNGGKTQFIPIVFGIKF